MIFFVPSCLSVLVVKILSKEALINFVETSENQP